MELDINRAALPFHICIYLYETHHVPISDAKMDTFIGGIHPPKPTFQYNHQYNSNLYEIHHVPISDAKMDTFMAASTPPKPTTLYHYSGSGGWSIKMAKMTIQM